ncbi:MAG: Crp/Fnr family transcriptional regulator [Candidatus Omnitrophota bacterium]
MENLLRYIRLLGIEKNLKKSQVLFMAGSPAGGFYYVVSGQIRAFRMSPEGRQIEISRFGPESFIGEVILFTQEFFPVSTEAITGSKVLFFSKQRILAEIAAKPEVALAFLRLLAGKCQILTSRIESLSLQNIRERLIRYLRMHSPKSGPYDLILPVKKNELARQLGTISATLSRTFRQLEKDRLIRVHKNTICIADCSRLA